MPVARQPVLLPGEHETLVALSQGPRRADLLADRLDDLVLAQCERTPDAVAAEQLDDDGATTASLRYDELATASGSLAARLRSHGVDAHDVVGVCLERRTTLPVALLGVLRAGAAWLPLDPAHPGPFLQRLLAAADATLVVTTRELRDRLLVPAGVPSARCVCVDDAALDDAAAPRVELGPDAPAYVIHTSGSTGEPKPVEIQHGAVASYMLAFRELSDVRPGDRLLHSAALGFDLAVEELFAPLVAGATVALRGDRMTATPDAVLTGAARAGITMLSLPTALWHELLRPEIPADAWPSSLRAVVIGGEGAIAPAVARWCAGPGRRLHLSNIYGPTETTIAVTRLDLPPGADAAETLQGAHTLTIGRPYPNVETWVLGPDGELLPQGAAGELHIGGRHVGRGYRGRPELTAERYAVHPVLGVRLYRTGDRVRWRADGNLDFLGRDDAQLKVRGHRVEPAAIEAALLELAGVAAAAVIGEPLAGGGVRLRGFVVADGERAPDGSALRASLSARVPDHLVPASISVVAALPHTSNGKLDRAALLAAVAPATAGEEPRTVTERMLAGLWCELLALPRVGRDAHFFDLGGHSLLAMRLAARLHATIHVTVPPRLLFEHALLSGQAEALDALQAESAMASEEGRLLAALAELEALDDREVRARLVAPEGS